MTKNCVKSIKLDNGLTLTLEDISRRISEDAFVVKALFSIEFKVTEADAAYAGLSLPEVIKVLGSETARFEKLLERNFISEDQKEQVFEEVSSSFLATGLTYLSHPSFTRGVVRKILVEKRGRYGSLPV
ncbi:hypothetical protein [Desulfoluna spongiiphila]|uniref:Uncharacterized protein n=1 Tax=Desulfoluna spongiiphila TaxID=419481 RepID=A0A1G5J5T5_9BACT|nr:hypothetical protein [Desulfoluna spongiiphila]SCY83554.1 hypothetical protein SAMN05216233_12537 [Desulfoluna spongiiphila]